MLYLAGTSIEILLFLIIIYIFVTDVEIKRRYSEKNLRAHSAREKNLEAEERAKQVKLSEFDKEWRDTTRSDNRINNWREFQEDPTAKKVKVSHYVQEAREGKVSLTSKEKDDNEKVIIL